MTKNVLIIGTLDTKGAEIAYLRDRLQELGLGTIVVDSGILGEPLGITLDPDRDVTRAAAARFGGTTIEALQGAGSRGKAVEGMREALKKLTLDLLSARAAGRDCQHGRRGRGRDGRRRDDAAACGRARKSWYRPSPRGSIISIPWLAPAISWLCTPSSISSV